MIRSPRVQDAFAKCTSSIGYGRLGSCAPRACEPRMSAALDQVRITYERSAASGTESRESNEQRRTAAQRISIKDTKHGADCQLHRTVELLCGTYPRRLCGAHCLLERRLPPHRGKSFDVCTGVLPPAYLLYPGEAPSQYRGTLKERCILLGYEIHQCHLAVVGVLSIPPLHKEGVFPRSVKYWVDVDLRPTDLTPMLRCVQSARSGTAGCEKRERALVCPEWSPFVAARNERHGRRRSKSSSG